MVTHWKDHWDKLPDNETYYTTKMLRWDLTTNEKLEINKILKNKSEKVPTVFVKLNENTKKLEKAWEGYTYDFRMSEDKKKIYFKVHIFREISPTGKIRELGEGWYADYEHESTDYENKSIFEKTALYPPLFYLLANTTYGKDFEELVYYLLKLLGIHDIIKFESQRGHPDGFFKFRNLAVVYDATLEHDFEELKRQQIENFSSILRKGEIEHGKISFHFHESRKEVWIITKNVSRVIRKINDIIVKEVSVYDLIELYELRIKLNLMENEFESQLMKIGENSLIDIS